MATRPLTNAEALPALPSRSSSDLLRERATHRARTRRMGARCAASSTPVAAGSRGARPRSSGRATPASSASRQSGSSPTPASCSGCSAAARPVLVALRVSVLDDLRGILAATALASMASLSLRILLPGDVDDLAPQSLRLLAFSAVYLAAGRVAYDWAQLNARRHGELAKPTLIVGAGRVGRLTANRLLEQPRARPRAGRLHRQGAARRAGPARARAGRRAGISSALDRAARDRARRRRPSRPRRARFCCARSERCEQLGVCVSLVPRLLRARDRAADRRSPRRPAAASSAQRADPKGLQFAFKYAVDRIVACAAAARARCRSSGCSRWGRCSRSGGRSSSASRASAATGASSRCCKFRSMRAAAGAARRAGRCLQTWRRRCRGRRPADRFRDAAAPHIARRAAAAAERAQGRDEPDRPATRARPTSSELFEDERLPLRRPPPRQVRDHRLGAGARACAARPRSATASSGTTTTSRTGRSGSTSRSC